MYLKRGLIYIVFLLLIPIVYSQSLTCEGGTRFASCKENTNLFCSNRNLILNGGFEADSNQDGIPNLFSEDPFANIGTDLIHSTDSLSGLKSILIKKQWASFDYPSSLRPIILQPNKGYIFFAFVKGSCNNLRIFYSQQQTGTANELCGSNKVCSLIPFGSEWKRLVTQFNSNEIQTKISQGSIQVPIIQNLRVECADSTPFQLYVDNMHLQPVDAPPQLIENCQICGSCPSGLFCAPDGSCVSDLSSFYTDEELMVKCIAENNFELCERISPAAKPLAFNLFATENNDISKCQDAICQQSVLYFNCIEQGRSNCVEESLSIFEQNPNFANGGDVYIKYQERQTKNAKLEKFKLGRGRDHLLNRCEIHVRREIGGSIDNDYYLYSLGTIITKDSSLWDLAAEKPEGRQTYFDTKENFPWDMQRDCGSNNCNLLEGEVIVPKADLLCGYDARWHLCDREGIKEFENREKFVCTSGRWTEI